MSIYGHIRSAVMMTHTINYKLSMPFEQSKKGKFFVQRRTRSGKHPHQECVTLITNPSDNKLLSNSVISQHIKVNHQIKSKSIHKLSTWLRNKWKISNRRRYERNNNTLHSAPGADGIHYSHMKETTKDAVRKITKDYNQSANTDQIPDLWLHSHLIPI